MSSCAVKSNKHRFSLFCSGLVLAVEARACVMESRPPPPDWTCRPSAAVTQSSVCRRLWWEKGYFLTPRHRDSHTCANVFVLTPASARQQKITSSGFLPPPSAHPQTRDIAGLLLFGPVYFLLSAPTVNETRCEQAHRSHLSHRTPSLPPSLPGSHMQVRSPPVASRVHLWSRRRKRAL